MLRFPLEWQKTMWEKEKMQHDNTSTMFKTIKFWTDPT